jgi:hypothetical protein
MVEPSSHQREDPFLKHIYLTKNKNLLGVMLSVLSSVRFGVLCRLSKQTVFSICSVRAPTLKGRFLLSPKRKRCCLAAIGGNTQTHRQEKDSISLLSESSVKKTYIVDILETNVIPRKLLQSLLPCWLQYSRTRIIVSACLFRQGDPISAPSVPDYFHVC